MISTKKRNGILVTSMSIGILVALGSIGIVKTASAVEPPVTQGEARAVNDITNGRLGIGVNEPGQGEILGIGYGTDGYDATGRGGIVGIGNGGDAQGGRDGGTGTGEGGVLGLGRGGDAVE